MCAEFRGQTKISNNNFNDSGIFGKWNQLAIEQKQTK